METVKIINKGVIDDIQKEKMLDIYSLEELASADFSTEPFNELVEDYDTLIETLYVSVAVNMWRFCHVKDELSTDEIIKIMQGDKYWYKNYYWTAEQRAGYERALMPIFMKWLGIDHYTAWRTIQFWSGFGSAFSFEDYSREYFEHYMSLVEEFNNLSDEYIDEDDVPDNK